MIQELNKNIYEIFELLKDSYGHIDFRSVLFRKDGCQNRLFTILRFSNKTEGEINKHYEELKIEKIKTENFEVEHRVVQVSEWEDLLIGLYNEIYEEIEIYDNDEFRYNYNQYEQFKSVFIEEFKPLYNTPSMRFYYTEEEVKKHNLISFHYNLSNENKDHNELFKILNKEILRIGEDDIHDIINRTLELDGYGSYNRLISILLPIYININDLAYSNDILTGKVIFHKIFNGSKIFLRIYSEPNYNNKKLTGREEFTIEKDGEETVSLENEYYESSFQIDFTKYDCDPNFKIRIFWDKIPNIYLVNLEKSFGSPKYLKSYEKLANIDEEQKKIDFKLNYENIIDLVIAIKEDYMEIIDNINNAYRKGLFDCVYILVRKLLENLMIDCLRKYYTMHKVDKFYNRHKEKFHSFSQLKINLNEMINDQDFKGSVGDIRQALIDYLEIFRETGNSSAHSFFSINHQHLIEDNRDKLIIIITQLVKIYNNINHNYEGDIVN